MPSKTSSKEPMLCGAAYSAAGPGRKGLAFGEGPVGLGIGVVRGEESVSDGLGDEGSYEEGYERGGDPWVVGGDLVLFAGPAVWITGPRVGEWAINWA